MRRSPFYAHPSFHPPQHNFFSNAYTPSPPQAPSTRPQPRSVRTIPVHDHHSVSPPSSSSHDPSKFSPPSATEIRRTIDLAAAATRIQSHFRGFSIRRHHPLLHLRTIATALKQLEAMNAKLESPGFARNVKTNEKERLRFNESIMAVILRLDAIEGSIPEIRLRRKEATKMAIKLQDAVDAILMEEGCEGLDVKQVDSTPNADRVVEENNPLDSEHSDVFSALNLTEATHEEDAAAILNGDAAEDADLVPDESSLTKEECHHKVDLVSNIEKLKHDVKEMAPALMRGNQVHLVDKSDEPECERVLLLGGCAADKLIPCIEEEEVMNTAEKESTCKEAGEGDTADVIPVEGVNTSAEEDKVGNAIIENDMKCTITPATLELENETQYNQCEEEECTDRLSGRGELGMIQENIGMREGHKEAEDGRREPEDEHMVSLMSREVGVGEGHESAGLQSSDRMLLDQLSEDCKQLKSMLSTLLVQSRAQSKVICALGERLKMLEHQQQLTCPQQYNQAKGRDKRKPKKGLKT